MSNDCQFPKKSKSKRVAVAVAALIDDAIQDDVECTAAPDLNYEQVNQRQIVCWPENRRVTPETRKLVTAEYTIAVAVLERLKPSVAQDDLTDELLAIAESIGDDLLHANVTTMLYDNETECTGTITEFDHTPLYNREVLEELKIFAGGILLTVRRSEPVRPKRCK